MMWEAWFLLSYLAVAAWVGASVIVFDTPVSKGSAPRAALLGLLIMWVLPLLLIGAILPGGKKK